MLPKICLIHALVQPKKQLFVQKILDGLFLILLEKMTSGTLADEGRKPVFSVRIAYLSFHKTVTINMNSCYTDIRTIGSIVQLVFMYKQSWYTHTNIGTNVQNNGTCTMYIIMIQQHLQWLHMTLLHTSNK